jgi:hypothetical protein
VIEMSCLNINQFKDTGRPYTARISLPSGETQDIHFTAVNVGYGLKRFFVCPFCARDCVKLYYDGNVFKCRLCAPVKLYNGIQNTTKGGSDYLYYKMVRFATKNGIGTIRMPFKYWNYPVPKNKHADKWLKNIAILQALENMRNQSIFFNTIWNNKTIQSIESGNNRLLDALSLFDLEKWFYNFDKSIE